MKVYVINYSDGAGISNIEGVFDSKELAISELKSIVENTNTLIKENQDIEHVKRGEEYLKTGENYIEHDRTIVLSFENKYHSVCLIEYDLNTLPNGKLLSIYTYIQEDK
jgi:hypothetical protein